MIVPAYDPSNRTRKQGVAQPPSEVTDSSGVDMNAPLYQVRAAWDRIVGLLFRESNCYHIIPSC